MRLFQVVCYVMANTEEHACSVARDSATKEDFMATEATEMLVNDDGVSYSIPVNEDSRRTCAQIIAEQQP